MLVGGWGEGGRLMVEEGNSMSGGGGRLQRAGAAYWLGGRGGRKWVGFYLRGRGGGGGIRMCLGEWWGPIMDAIIAR